MPIDPRILDLVIEYEERLERGEPVTPEALCSADPTLLPELRRRLHDVGRIDWAFGPPRSSAPVRSALPRIPGYDLLEEVGRGGMGVVFEARQTALDRIVAVKMVLPRGPLGTRERVRFRTEAEAVAKLQHPHIVQVYEVGEVEGVPYLVLEFVRGTSLARHIGDRPQPARQAAELVATLARAVQHAHEQGVVHRDLKPENVLLDQHGQPLLTDFGLAKRLDRAEGITRSEEVLGTPSYLAPEQVGGQTVGPATDVYGLGGVLYKMLTGRPPFVGEALEDILLQVVRDLQ